MKKINKQILYLFYLVIIILAIVEVEAKLSKEIKKYKNKRIERINTKKIKQHKKDSLDNIFFIEQRNLVRGEIYSLEAQLDSICYYLSQIEKGVIKDSIRREFDSLASKYDELYDLDSLQYLDGVFQIDYNDYGYLSTNCLTKEEILEIQERKDLHDPQKQREKERDRIVKKVYFLHEEIERLCSAISRIKNMEDPSYQQLINLQSYESDVKEISISYNTKILEGIKISLYFSQLPKNVGYDEFDGCWTSSKVTPSALDLMLFMEDDY